jgi:hypothetical protein
MDKNITNEEARGYTDRIKEIAKGKLGLEMR